MLYCPKCKCKITLSVTIEDIPAEFSINILTNALNLALCSLGNFTNLVVSGYKCTNCGKICQTDDLLVKSQISNKFDNIKEFIIVSIKNKRDEVVNGKVILIIPPKVIHKDELQKFKESNPYNDDKYLIINPLNKIDFIAPK